MKKKTLANATKLSRTEMKQIMAGTLPVDGDGGCGSGCSGSCTFSGGGTGTCTSSSSGKCYCAGASSIISD